MQLSAAMPTNGVEVQGCIRRRPMRFRLEAITALHHHLSPVQTSGEEGGGVEILAQPLIEVWMRS